MIHLSMTIYEIWVKQSNIAAGGRHFARNRRHGLGSAPGGVVLTQPRPVPPDTFGTNVPRLESLTTQPKPAVFVARPRPLQSEQGASCVTEHFRATRLPCSICSISCFASMRCAPPIPKARGCSSPLRYMATIRDRFATNWAICHNVAPFPDHPVCSLPIDTPSGSSKGRS